MVGRDGGAGESGQGLQGMKLNPEAMAAIHVGTRGQAELVKDGSLCLISSVGGTTLDSILVVMHNRQESCWSGTLK